MQGPVPFPHSCLQPQCLPEIDHLARLRLHALLPTLPLPTATGGAAAAGAEPEADGGQDPVPCPHHYLFFLAAPMSRHACTPCCRPCSFLLQQAEQLPLVRCLKQMEVKAQDLAGIPFNIDSPKEVAHVLFNVLQLPVPPQVSAGGGYHMQAGCRCGLLKKHGAGAWACAGESAPAACAASG